MNVIECSNVSKTFLRKKALDGMSFSIGDNTITGLVGRNGAGKTTLLKLIAGFLKPASGKLKVFSEDPFNSLTVSANSIFVDDSMVFPSAVPLGEILDEAGRFYPNWDGKLAQRLFDYFSFDPKNYHNRLSKGKTSTFNAIIGIASRCPLTLFDEPTTGMDEAARKDFYRALLKDYIAFPRTIILSSHHLEEIEDILEDILFIQNGRNLLHMPMADLREWAVSLRGNREVVLAAVAGRDVINQKALGQSTLTVVVRNRFSEVELNSLRGKGLEVLPVSTSDLFVYVTNERKGGIDDVFKEDNTLGNR
ncbi:ATP-binding cassette domain-containing protein [Bacillus sp. EB01]|uniref:ATP-binding cassette domain-containing protein n=1 Tax=Bacillus sp. EB01 TaxID=1347086 RepID=UPI0005C6D3D6|nr:ABC transporter ATP-binding protein [Bacillus sp. EB01]